MKKRSSAPATERYKKPNLTAKQLNKLCNELPQGQCLRVFEFLYFKKRPVSTAELCRECATGNVSHNVAELNTILADHKMQITHFRPEPTLCNRFGQTSQMHVWCLEVL